MNNWSTPALSQLVLMGMVLMAAGGSVDGAAPTASGPPGHTTNEKKTLEGAAWELQALGITDEQMRARLVTKAVRRPVTIAIVGISGVSESALSNYFKPSPEATPPWLPWLSAFEYREGATDPQQETHDTGQARVILDLTRLLGLRIRLLVYQPPEDYGAIGEAFAKAGQEADIIVCFHSFWGPNVPLLVEKTRETSSALFIAPYGETGGFPTGEAWQAQAAKPDGGGIGHFITAIPLARKAPGELLHPSARDERDTQTINFIAPSFYANGPGGTCPAAATTAAVAAFVYATSRRQPKPTEVVQLLRDTVTVDEAALTSLTEFDEETLNQLEAGIERLVQQKKLAARGVLSLRNLYRRLAQEALPPPTQSPQGVLRARSPQVRIAGEKVELENTYFRAELTTKPLLLRRLYHPRAAAEGLAPGQASHLFAVAVDDELMTSDEFEVTSAQSSAQGRSRVLTLALRAARVVAELTVRLDGSDELRLGLQVTNTDRQPHRLRIFFPLLNHVSLGEVRDNFYFYPFKGGWASGVPFHLGHGYGTPGGSLQLMSVFNPSRGGSLSVWTRDPTGAMKTLWLRKVEEAGVMPPVYESLREEMRATLPLSPPSEGGDGGVFDLQPGVSLAFSPLARTVAPNQTALLPEAVVGFYPGDCREALRRYTRWVRTWWRPPQPPVPRWLRRYFNVCALHDHESLRRSRYAGPEQLRPSHQMFQWSLWWEHPEVDRFNQPRPGEGYRLAMGDYQYEPRWGGAEAMRREIQRFHDAGLTAVVYLQSYLVWKHSRLGREHGEEWAARSPDGKPREDWTSPETDMDVWDFCVGHPAYQDYLADTARRLLTETGADGIYLDSAADAYPCYDQRHGHGDEPAQFSLAALRQVRQALKETHPQAILHIEDVCSEHHLQFIDGAWLKEFEMYPPMSNYTPHFDAYPLYFLRFYFPEVWFADWGTGDYAPGWRWCFFNGIGTCRWPNDYTARTGRVLQENAVAFASLHPEPLIPTEREGVYANRFPTESKTVYTVYNRLDETASGVLLTVPHRKGYHYVELLSGQEVAFEVRGQEAHLSLEVPAQEVVAIAQTATLLEVRRQGDRLTVQVRGRIRQPRLVARTTDDPDEPGEPVALQNGRAVYRIPPHPPLRKGGKEGTDAPHGWVRVQLFSGEEWADERLVTLQGFVVRHEAERSAVQGSRGAM